MVPALREWDELATGGNNPAGLEGAELRYRGQGRRPAGRAQKIEEDSDVHFQEELG